MGTRKHVDEDGGGSPLTPSLYFVIVEEKRRRGLNFDTTAIVGGDTVEFYLKGKRVAVHHVCAYTTRNFR